MASQIAHPVQTLREHATSFEAALSVCLAEPSTRAVHKLRTEARRLEAQIALLLGLRGLPPYRKSAAKALRQIAKVRRAAGRVRDLDVQSKLLQQYGKQKPAPAPAHPEAEGSGTAAQRHDDLEQMVATRQQRRLEGAAELTALIQRRQGKVSVALERLLKALHPAHALRLSAPELVRIADQQFRKSRALKRKEPSEEALHTIRKAAKQARYLTETSGSQPAVMAAKRYEHLQDAGGRWHDWLDLAGDADKELGQHHGTAMEFAQKRDRRLLTYQTLLEDFRGTSGGRAVPVKAVPVKKARPQISPKETGA